MFRIKIYKLFKSLVVRKSLTALVILFILACTAVASFVFYPFISVTGGGDRYVKLPVRVRLVHNFGSAEISSDRPVYLRVLDTKVPSAVFQKGRYRIFLDTKGINIGERFFSCDKVTLSPLTGAVLEFDGKKYRGDMIISRSEFGLDAINLLDLEDYLKGVVPAEVNQYWPYEALKAQAIVSRSFALYQVISRKYKDHDLKDDTFSQVYGGVSAEKWRTSKAVEDTRGQALAFKGKAFPAYFHSACGGSTEDASVLWKNDILPLKGVKCPWCRFSPYFEWTKRIPTKTIIKALNDAGLALDRIDEIKFSDPDPSGRSRDVCIRSADKQFDIKLPEFSKSVPSALLSANGIQVKKHPFFYEFSGRGWGHGVGMCQWGAFGLSLRLLNADEILKYYYPGSEKRYVSDLLKGTDGGK
jgi:stage II sporulation protein D